jgi:methionyl-tRNA synthetase
MWPAQLLGARGLYSDDPQANLNLPYDVPANEFMNMEGRKISGSQNWGVWMLDALERHDPDPLRYYLTAVMPETRDSDWSWQGYIERNNSELVGNWGNLVNRVLSMTKRYFKGVVPDPGELTEKDTALLTAVDNAFDSVGALYDACKFRAATQEILRVCTLVNQYLEEMSPGARRRPISRSPVAPCTRRCRRSTVSNFCGRRCCRFPARTCTNCWVKLVL